MFSSREKTTWDLLIKFNVYYLVDQAVSPFFCVFIVFIFDKFDRCLTTNLGNVLNGEKINSSEPKPEPQQLKRVILMKYLTQSNIRFILPTIIDAF